MKKLYSKIILVMVFFLLIFTFYSCKQDKGESSGNMSGELEIAPFLGGFGPAYWEKVIENFKEKYPDVKIKFSGSPKLEEMLAPRFISGDVPDIVQIYVQPNCDTRIWGKEGLLMDLSDLLEEDTLDGNGKMKDLFQPGVLDFPTMKVDQKQVALPFNSTIQGIYYDKTVMDENNWDIPETWADFFELGEKVKAKYGKNKYYWIYQGIYPDYMHVQFYLSIANYNKPTFESLKNGDLEAWEHEAVYQALNLFERMAQNNLVFPGVTSMNHTQSQVAFLQKKAFMIPNGTWFENEMKEFSRTLKTPFNYGFMPIPAPEKGGPRYYVADYEAIYIPAKAKNPGLAKEFLKFLYTKQSMKLYTEMTTGYKPCRGAIELGGEAIPDSIKNVLSTIEETGALPLTDKLDTANGPILGVIWENISSLMLQEMTAMELHDKVIKMKKSQE